MKKSIFEKLFFVLIFGVITLPYFSFAATTVNSPAPAPFSVSTNPATGITTSSVTLRGSYDAGGFNSISVRFEWGETSSLGNFTAFQNVSNDGVFSQNISVSPSKTYYFRATGTAIGSGIILGQTLSFTTPSVSGMPIIQTLPATNISSTSAKLKGFYNSNGLTTSTRFEYANNSGFNPSNITALVTQTQSSGEATHILSNLTPNTTYYFRFSGENGFGEVDGGILSFTTGSIVIPNNCKIDSFYADPSIIKKGQSTKLYWQTTNCLGASINQNIGNVTVDGDINTGTLNDDTYFVLSAWDNNVEIAKTLTVNTTSSSSGGGGGGGGSAPCRIDEFYSYPTTISYGEGVWLYWKVNYCSDIYISGVGSQSKTSQAVFVPNLLSTTTFTLTATRGSTTKTANTTVNIIPRTVVSNPVSNPVSNTITYVQTSGQSLIDFEVSSSFENVSRGERYLISIKYNNTSSVSTAKKSKIEIILPKDLIFEKISNGNYNKADHKILIDLESIAPKKKDEIVLEVMVSNKADSGQKLVTIGALTYEKNGVKEEVIDILANTVEEGGSVLGAFALGAFSGTLLGWLISILLLMIIYAIARQIYKERKIA